MIDKRAYIIHDELFGDIRYLCHPKCCLFCDKCADVFYDYYQGPHTILCNDPRATREMIQAGFRGECDHFVEE